jgi:diguanylate cyclase
MNQSKQQYHNTISIAGAALGKIGALRQPADPRSYALWFKYASGDSGLLSAAMNSRPARNGTLTAGDIQELHDAHIAPGRVQTKTDRIGVRIAGEIDQILATVEVAEDTASHFSRDLASAAQRLASTVNRADVRAIIDALVQAARTAAEKNARLQTQLQAMSEEIAQLRREIVDLRTESQTDPLTGLGNRRFFLAALDRAITESRATNEPLTLLLADVESHPVHQWKLWQHRRRPRAALHRHGDQGGDHRTRRRCALWRRRVRDPAAEDQPAPRCPHRRAAPPRGHEM